MMGGEMDWPGQASPSFKPYLMQHQGHSASLCRKLLVYVVPRLPAA
jgi:hypothetical protein